MQTQQAAPQFEYVQQQQQQQAPQYEYVQQQAGPGYQYVNQVQPGLQVPQFYPAAGGGQTFA